MQTLSKNTDICLSVFIEVVKNSYIDFFNIIAVLQSFEHRKSMLKSWLMWDIYSNFTE